jgi:hypothetical protein
MSATSADQPKAPDAVEQQFVRDLRAAAYIFQTKKNGRFQGSILACAAVAQFIQRRGGPAEYAAPFMHIAEAFKDLERGGRPRLFSKKTAPEKERERSPERKHFQMLAAAMLEALIKLGNERPIAAEKIARHVNKWPGMGVQTVTGKTVIGWREQQRRSSFDFSRRSINAELARRLSPEVSVSGGYQIQYTHTFDITSDQRLIDRIFPKKRLSSFSTSVIRDTRDDPFGPLRGQYLSANGQIAAKAVGSEVGFTKSFFTAQTFRTVPRTSRIVVAGSARLGLATGFGPEVFKDLPDSERFYAGGDTTVRGFAIDQLGIRHVPSQDAVDTIDAEGFPLGGNGLVIFNGEVRVPVHGELGVVGFLDAGNVFKRASDISLVALRPALGFGVRYKSPVGPIRFDMGFKLDRRSYEGAKAWFITFGQAF